VANRLIESLLTPETHGAHRTAGWQRWLLRILKEEVFYEDPAVVDRYRAILRRIDKEE